MHIETFCITPEAEMFAQIRENCAATKRWAKSLPAHDGAAVLVGGGPSVLKHIDGIRKRQQHGQKVFAMNGAAKLLNDHGILPDYQVLLDPQKLLQDYIAPAADYLVASQCHPSVLKRLPGAMLWHLATEGVAEQIPDHDDDYCLTGGGISVGLSAMPLAYALGYRKLHIYGYDSSHAEDACHAYPVTDSVSEHKHRDGSTIIAKVFGKKFTTTLGLLQQAQEFHRVAGDLIDLGCLITVDCDGLLRAMVDENNALNAVKAA